MHGGAIGAWGYLILIGVFLGLGDFLDSHIDNKYFDWAIFLFVVLSGYFGRKWPLKSNPGPTSIKSQFSELKATIYGLALGTSLWWLVEGLFPEGFIIETDIVIFLIVAAFLFGIALGSKQKESSDSSDTNPGSIH